MKTLSHSVKQMRLTLGDFLYLKSFILWMSILIVLRSRIWFCFISAHCSTNFMVYIFTLICFQRVAIVLVCFFYHDGGFWFGRYTVFDSFVTIRCSMYCDIIELILS